MSGELVLFSTDHCTLCDEALELLLSMPELAGCPVRVVDIVNDEALFASYGEAIPVLEVRYGPGRTETLRWPFDSGDVLASLSQLE